MASKRPFSDEDFMCPVCWNVFKEPVLLSCGHSACSSCVHQYWEAKFVRECPLCRQSSVTDPPINLALKKLCLKIQGDPETLCDIHGEKLKLFCVNEGHAVCVVCKDSREHLHHSFVPVDEAASEQKTILTGALNILKMKMNSLLQAQGNCHHNIFYLQQQAKYTEDQINEEFKKLKLFLQTEEAHMVTELEKEVQQKTASIKDKIGKIQEEINTLANLIRDINVELQSEDIKFVKNFDTNMSKARYKNQAPTPSREVISFVRYLGNLQFQVWSKMQSFIRYSPVVLDPNTAHSQLVLSPDLTSVRDCDEAEDEANLPRPPVLDTPERFKSFCVLGSEGFFSGMHCWDVEVGNSTFWMLGVTTESVQKKEPTGAWGIGYDTQQLCARSPLEGYTPLAFNAKPQAVRIRLDVDLGEVWFLDPASDAVIHMFSHHFTEKVFPFFHSMCSLSPLKIMPLQLIVMLENLY